MSAHPFSASTLLSEASVVIALRLSKSKANILNVRAVGLDVYISLGRGWCVCVWMCKGPFEILFVYNIIHPLNLNVFRCHTISKAIIKVLWSLFKMIKPFLSACNLKYLNKHNPKCMTFIFAFPWFHVHACHFAPFSPFNFRLFCFIVFFSRRANLISLYIHGVFCSHGKTP